MLFSGKSIDGFEYALNGLLKRQGGQPVAFADALSYRNFAFVCGTKISDWFAPALRWQDYLAVLEKNSGYSFLCLPICDALERGLMEQNEGEWFLLGELDIRACEETVRSRFYHAAPGFSLCRKLGKGSYEVSDPLGCPSYFLTQTELEKLTINSKGYFLSYICSGDDVGQKAAYREVFMQGLRWKQSTAHEQGRLEQLDFCRYYHGIQSEKVSLKYALMNYQVQMWKLIQFAAAAFGENAAVVQELDFLLSALCLTDRDDKNLDLAAIDSRCWSLIKDWTG